MARAEITVEVAAILAFAGPVWRPDPAAVGRSGPLLVLVDAGWPGDGPRIERAAATLFGAGLPSVAILLTHEHPDHEGDALQLARRWGCPVYVPEAEMPIARRDLDAMKAAAMPLVSAAAMAGSGFSQTSRTVATVESWFSHSPQ